MGFKIIRWPTCLFHFWFGVRCDLASAAQRLERCWCQIGWHADFLQFLVCLWDSKLSAGLRAFSISGLGCVAIWPARRNGWNVAGVRSDGTLISFNSWFVYGIQNYPLAYVPFPFLVWGALRFGQRGATAGTLLVSALAIYSLLQGIGPFVTNTEKDSLMLIGSYIGILAVTNMLLAAAAAERRAAERAVSESEKRFRAVVEDQTDLICRFKPDGLLT